MRKILVGATLFLCALSGQAQEKVMNILKTDGTNTQTRVADLSQISFLTIDGSGQGLLVKTLDDNMAAVLFETTPVVTVSSGKLIVKSSSSSSLEFEISNIAEIQFGDASEVTAITELKGFSCVLQDNGVALQGIPKGIKPLIYTLDGRSLPTPPFHNGELRLNRATLGTGIFIIKVGTFSTKIQF